MEKENTMVKFSNSICDNLNSVKASYVRVNFVNFEGFEDYVDGIFKGIYGSRTIKLEVEDNIGKIEEFIAKRYLFIPLAGEENLKITEIYDANDKQLFSLKNPAHTTIYKKSINDKKILFGEELDAWLLKKEIENYKDVI